MPENGYVAERRYLIISAICNLCVGCFGMVFSYITSSQAILLDGLFNVTYFATALLTLKVARLVQRGDDERFPCGYAFFEPLINGLKGVLVLGVTLMAVASAIEALISGGRSISPGLAVIYGVIASVLCWSAAWLTRRGAQRSGSPLVQADAENWVVNGAVSSAVLLAFGGIALLKLTPWAHLAVYADPTIVLVVALISISVPVRMSWQALMELMNRAPAPEIVAEVHATVTQCLNEQFPDGQSPDKKASLLQELFVRVIQPGRTRLVLVHAVMSESYCPEGVITLDAIRAEILQRLQQLHPPTTLDMIFTGDRRWGAPAADACADSCTLSNAPGNKPHG